MCLNITKPAWVNQFIVEVYIEPWKNKLKDLHLYMNSECMQDCIKCFIFWNHKANEIIFSK